MNGDVRLPVPRSLDEVTSAWLSRALGESIEVVSRDRVGTGQVGLSVRLVLAGIVGSSDRGIAMFSAMTERHFQHAEDVDAADFLR